jgi:FkbM family methyltransferase
VFRPSGGYLNGPPTKSEIATGIIMQGVGRGLRFNPGNSNAGFVLGTSEPGLQNMLKNFLKPGMTFYDLGANVGFLTVIAARLVGPSGKVVSFEPVSSNLKQIEHNLKLNDFRNVVVRSEALGGIDGQGRFLLSTEPNFGKLESAGLPPVKHCGDTTVVVRTLDSIASEQRLPAPDVIKIDVEGAETEVLRGATSVLKTARPILLIELHGTNRDVSDLLDRLDYSCAVLGNQAPISEASWNAHVVAVPSESRKHCSSLNEITRS